MNFSSRDDYIETKKRIHAIFPFLKSIDDFCYLNCNHTAIAVFTGLNKCVPFFSEIKQNKDIVKSLEKHNSSNLLFVYKNKTVKVFDENNVEITFPIIPYSILEKLFVYGGTLNKDGDLIFDSKSEHVGTHYAVNLLLGDRSKYSNPLQSTPKSVVDELGRGSFRAYSAYQVLATTWGISPEENGHPANRQFYIVEDNQPLFYSADKKTSESIKTIHHPNFTEILYITKNDLEIKRTIFLLPQLKSGPEACEVQLIEIKNTSSSPRDVSLICTGMFATPDPSAQMVDVIYSTVIAQNRIYFNEDHSIKALTPDYYPEYFKREIKFVSMNTDDGFADSFTTDYAAFIGNGDLYHPDMVTSLNEELAMKGPNFFALKKVIHLNEQQTKYAFTLTGYTDEKGTTGDSHLALFEQKLNVLLEKMKDSRCISKALQGIKKEEENYDSHLQITRCEDERFKAYVNHNLPFQVKYQTFVSRSFAMTQKGYREIGFREIQDLYASIPYFLSQGKRKLVKSLLEEWIENVYEFGYVNHNFFYVGKEPGMCSDDGLWLIHAVKEYIDLTNDISFLNQRFSIAGKKKKRTLSDTIFAILTYSGRISLGNHNLPLLDGADWNDCLRLDPEYLSGPEKEKAYKAQIKKLHQKMGARYLSNQSESVMNAFLVIIASKEAALLYSLTKEKEKETECLSISKDMTYNVQKNAYIHGYYARVLLNKDNKVHTSYVGSYKDKLSLNQDIDGSFYLNSFSWSLLSETADIDQIKEMLPILETKLKCDAGFKLCTEHDLSLAGAKSSSTDHYFKGDRENGGVFKHACMMCVVSLLRTAKRIDEYQLKKRLLDNAFFMIDLALPYNVMKNISLYKGNPRFCTQYNNSITQENIGPMLSGTATWLTLAIEEICGCNIKNGALECNPCLPLDESELSYSYKTEKAVFHITIKKRKGTYGSVSKKKTYLDGKEESNIMLSLEGEHDVEITFD